MGETEHSAARCAGCGRAPVGPATVFCAPCFALIAMVRPLSRPVRTPQWRAPGAKLHRAEEVTTVAYV